MSLVVIDIPSKDTKERIGEVLAELGFVVIASFGIEVCCAVERVPFNKGLDREGCKERNFR